MKGGAFSPRERDMHIIDCVARGHRDMILRNAEGEKRGIFKKRRNTAFYRHLSFYEAAGIIFYFSPIIERMMRYGFN